MSMSSSTPTRKVVQWVLSLSLGSAVALWLYQWRTRRLLAWKARLNTLKQSPDFVQRHAFYAPVRGKPTRLLFSRASSSGSCSPDTPTLVFVHGFGGNIDQFAQLLDLFSHVAPVAALDLVGHGYSPDSGRAQDYTTESLVADLADAISSHLAPKGPLILVAHSYGCCLSTHLLASYPTIAQRVRAVVLMTPKALWTDTQRKHAHRLASLPAPLIDLLRLLDRRGGIHSASVRRFVPPSASDALKWRQLAWNQHLTSTQIKHMNHGMRWVTPADYARITCPTLLLGGELDGVTPADPNLAQVYDLLTSLVSPEGKPDPIVFPGAGHQIMVDAPGQVHAEMAAFFASPAVGLATLFDPRRALPQDPADQKWNLKNYEKWVKTSAVGACVHSNLGTKPPVGKVRGMKVLRETDASHSPATLARDFPHVKLVVDFTKDRPPYDPRSLAALGIQYRKVATTSKVPPSPAEVDEFLLVLRDFWAACADDDERARVEVVCHCHYGFNRTGFMLACWLVQEQGVPVGEAIERVAAAREPGIKHVHFKDELFLRYAPRQRVRSLQARSSSPPPAAAGTTLTSAAVAAAEPATSLLGSFVNVVRKMGSRDPSPDRPAAPAPAPVAATSMSPTKAAASVPLPASPDARSSAVPALHTAAVADAGAAAGSEPGSPTPTAENPRGR